MSETALVAETEAWYQDAETRLRLCRSCPAEGGACASDVGSAVKVGRKPTWVGAELQAATCDRWREHLTRERLESSNVPKFFLDSKFTTFARPLDTPELTKLTAFVDGSTKSRGGFLFLCGGHGSGKTRLGVATLRMIIRRAPRALLWYTDMTAVSGAMRQRYDEKEPFGDHFGNAREADVTIVDNVDVRAPEWVHERLETLLRERWLGRRSTLVGMRSSVEELARIYSTIPDLKTATICNLQ
jgi:DNA replication protein DnaC